MKNIDFHPQQIQKDFGDVQFDSKFDGGNLAKVERCNQN